MCITGHEIVSQEIKRVNKTKKKSKVQKQGHRVPGEARFGSAFDFANNPPDSKASLRNDFSCLNCKSGLFLGEVLFECERGGGADQTAASAPSHPYPTMGWDSSQAAPTESVCPFSWPLPFGPVHGEWSGSVIVLDIIWSDCGRHLSPCKDCAL